MKINVGKLKNLKGNSEAFQVAQEVDAKAAGYPEMAFAGPLVFAGTATNHGDLLDVTGRVTGSLILTCSRCLEPFCEQLDFDFAESYTNKAEIAAADLEEEINLFSGDMIDLTENILRQIFLTISMQPVCSEGCLGICSHCGTNLNLSTCTCEQEQIDPRMEKLQLLLNSIEKGVE